MDLEKKRVCQLANIIETLFGASALLPGDSRFILCHRHADKKSQCQCRREGNTHLMPKDRISLPDTNWWRFGPRSGGFQDGGADHPGTVRLCGIGASDLSPRLCNDVVQISLQSPQRPTRRSPAVCSHLPGRGKRLVFGKQPGSVSRPRSYRPPS